MSVAKKISFWLSVSEINRAMRELEQYKRDFIRKVELLRERVAERLAQKADSGFTGAIVDDLRQGESARLADVKVSVENQGNVTLVIASGEDAIWVEFGAGVYHNGSAGSSTHPKGAELGFTIGEYGKGYGKRPAWGFYEDGELHITHGAPAAIPEYILIRVEHIGTSVLLLKPFMVHHVNLHETIIVCRTHRFRVELALVVYHCDYQRHGNVFFGTQFVDVVLQSVGERHIVIGDFRQRWQLLCGWSRDLHRFGNCYRFDLHRSGDSSKEEPQPNENGKKDSHLRFHDFVSANWFLLCSHT